MAERAAHGRLCARAGEAVTALVWLTRLPLGRFLPRPVPTLGQSAWAFPLAGAAVGAIAALVLLGAEAAGLSGPIAAILTVGAGIWITGGLHEDGLADFADGSGGTTRARRLEIMRDSRIGSYGVLALIIVIGLRIAALSALIAASPALAAVAVIAVAAASRSGLVLALAWLAPARADGLGHLAGRPRAASCLAALAWGGLALACTAWLLPYPVLGWAVLALAIAVTQCALGLRARAMLGGQTGDVLGAMQQVGEVAGLVVLCALV